VVSDVIVTVSFILSTFRVPDVKSPEPDKLTVVTL